MDSQRSLDICENKKSETNKQKQTEKRNSEDTIQGVEEKFLKIHYI